MRGLIVLVLFLVMGCAAAQPPAEEVDLQKSEEAPLILPTNLQCFPWPILQRILFLQYRETNVGSGVLHSQHGDYVTHLFVSENGSWSFAVTSPEAVSCILAYGTRWTVAIPPPGA